MQIFESTITVTQDDIDELNHVNNVRYVQWVNDIAKQHWVSKSTIAIRDSYFWVLLSHHIQYKRQALLGDVLKLKTFVVKSEGIKSTRSVEIYNKETDELLITSETVWCFMSMETKRPTRITDDITALFC